MRLHRKPRKLIRTAFIVCTVLSTAAYLSSGWLAVGYLTSGGEAFLSSGLLEIWRRDKSSIVWEQAPPGWYLNGPNPPRFFFGLDWESGSPYFPEFLRISIPIWPLVLMLILGNSYWYWRDWRNRLRPSYCRDCGHDLRATPNRCPECGNQPKPTYS